MIDEYETNEESVTRIFHSRERESETASERLFEERGYEDETDFLRDAGEALYGDRWQSSIARDLEVSDRTVRYWSAGKFAIPGGVIRDIVALLEAREAQIGRVRSGGERMVQKGDAEDQWRSEFPEGGDDGYG